jgi:uncharacterized protein YdgA (DUF945 family)
LNNFPRPLVLAAIAGCLIVAYPAAAWYTGTRVEATMNTWSTQANQYPNLKVVKHEFKRGVFSSTEDTIIEFPAGLFPKLPPVAGAPEPQSLQVHFINHIKHGPFPGLRFGSATIDTELVLDDTTKAAAEKIFGQQAPLQILTKLNYLGGGSVLLSSPAVTTTIDQTQSKIEWKGIKLDIGFSGDYKDLSMKLDAPGLNAHMQDGSNLVMGAIAANGTMQQVAPNSFLYLGKTTATLDQLKMSSAVPTKSFDLQKLTIESDVSSKADLIDMVAKVGAQKLITSKMEFSDIHYDYGIRHLHQPTLIKLVDAIYHPPQNQAGTDPTQNVIGPWKEFGPILLQNKPEFSIDRISVTTPEGEAKLSATATIGDASIDDLQSFALLMPKLLASATVSVPEPMMTKLMMGSVTDPDMQAKMQQGFKQQIATFEQQGYIIRKDQILSANLDWKQGQMTINGKPMPGAAH